MNADIQWLIGMGLPIMALLIGVIWAHLRKEVATLQAGLVQLEIRFEQRSKDKDKFDYEFRHNEYAPTITRINAELLPLVRQVNVIDKRVEELKFWKHETVDPYIPRAVDEHERRINKLDAKIFNGHK